MFLFNKQSNLNNSFVNIRSKISFLAFFVLYKVKQIILLYIVLGGIFYVKTIL